MTIHPPGSKHSRIIDLAERRRNLQRRAAAHRAHTGNSYPGEVHLLLGQSYLDPATWRSIQQTHGIAGLLRRARFAQRYEPLLRRLKEAVERYERS